MIIMASLSITKTDDYYWNYHTTVFIGTDGHQKFSTLNGWEIFWTFTSNDSGQPGTGSITIYNVAPQHMRSMKPKTPVSIWTGPPKLFGRLCLGTITKVTQGYDDKDHTVTISFSESAGYENQQAIKIFNGDKTVTTKAGKKSKRPTKKTVPKLVSKTFNKNVKAKQIIQFVKSKAKIRISRLKLANNKTYKRGYRLSQRPLQALQQLATDCGSRLYYRNSNIVIDDGKSNNPFKEHLALGIGTGLLQQPAINQRVQKNKKGKITSVGTHTFTSLEDPRVLAGSAVFFDPATVKGMSNNLYPIKTITHQHNKAGYTMNGEVYG